VRAGLVGGAGGGFQDRSAKSDDVRPGTSDNTPARSSAATAKTTQQRQNEELIRSLKRPPKPESRPQYDVVEGDEVSLFNDDARYLWRGALLDSAALSNGKLVPIHGVPRAPGTIVVSDLYSSRVENLGSLPTTHGIPQIFTVEVIDPTFANSHDALHAVFVRNKIEPAATRTNIDIKSFETVDDAMVKVGASASFLSVSLKGSISSRSYLENNNFVVNVLQPYYTVDFLYPKGGAHRGSVRGLHRQPGNLEVGPRLGEILGGDDGQCPPVPFAHDGLQPGL
jgi:hypothetical protein